MRRSTPQLVTSNIRQVGEHVDRIYTNFDLSVGVYHHAHSYASMSAFDCIVLLTNRLLCAKTKTDGCAFELFTWRMAVTSDAAVVIPVTLEAAWAKLTARVKECKALDLLFAMKAGGMTEKELTQKAADAISELKESHAMYVSTQPIEDLSNERLRTFERYTDGLPLKPFRNAMHLVPSLVNLVSLADAIPLDGSSLPFDLRKIAVRCKNVVYFAPRRFTAVQLAFDQPRSRVLLFRTRHAFEPRVYSISLS